MIGHDLRTKMANNVGVHLNAFHIARSALVILRDCLAPKLKGAVRGVLKFC